MCPSMVWFSILSSALPESVSRGKEFSSASLPALLLAPRPVLRRTCERIENQTMEEKMTTTKNKTTNPDTEPALGDLEHFGVCPKCSRTDGSFNVGREHWFFCDAHKLRWLGGENCFRSWREESPADWERNQQTFGDYRDITHECVNQTDAKASAEPSEDMALIFAYTRANALADGVLMDATELAHEMGFTFPVALTDTVHAAYVRVPEGVRWQDETGRLRDILWMLFVAIKKGRSTGDRILFQVSVQNHEEQPAQLVTLKALCGPGDDHEPVLTVMMPSES